MTGNSPLERAKRNATGIAATTVTGTWLAMFMLGFEPWLAVMLFGYIVVVPVVSTLFDEEEKDDERTSAPEGAPDTATASGERSDTTDALDRLRSRYADGQLTDEQFERKLGRLLETETVEDAADWVKRERAQRVDGADGEPGEDGNRGADRTKDVETGSNRR